MQKKVFREYFASQWAIVFVVDLCLVQFFVGQVETVYFDRLAIEEVYFR